MTKTPVRTALAGIVAAVAAIAMAPTIAAAQTVDQPARKPAVQERQGAPRAANPDKARRPQAEGRRDVADRREDRPHRHERDRNKGEEHRERRG